MRRNRVVMSLAICAATSALVMCTACDPPVEDPPPAVPAAHCAERPIVAGESFDSESSALKVGVIGDSLTAMTWCAGGFDAFEYNLGAAAINGNHVMPGEIWGQNHTWLSALKGADVIVFMLGTNDAKNEALDIGDVEVELEVLANEAITDGAACIGFMTVDTTNSSWGSERAAQLNEWVRSQSIGLVADWETVAVQHPEYFDDPDNPHFNVVGQEAFVNLIEDTAQRCDLQ